MVIVEVEKIYKIVFNTNLWFLNLNENWFILFSHHLFNNAGILEKKNSLNWFARVDIQYIK